MLEKRLTPGGLQVGGPRTLQNPNRFRVANNVYQTLDGYYVPRFDNVDYEDGIAAGYHSINVRMFRGLPFVIARSDTTFALKTYYGSPLAEIFNTLNPATFTYPSVDTDGDFSFGIQFEEKNDVLLINVPILGLYKFDGLLVTKAGVPTSYGGTAESGANTAYFRYLQINVDYAGNVAYSGYAQNFHDYTGTSLTVDGNRDDYYLGTSGVGPWTYIDGLRRRFDHIAVGFDYFFYHKKAATTITLVGSEWRVELEPGQYQLEAGCWVQWIAAHPVSAVTVLMSMKCDRVSGGFAYFTHIKYYDEEVWTDAAAIPVAAFTMPDFATTQWITLWSSTTATGNYVYKGTFGMHETKTIDVTSLTVAASTTIVDGIFNISGNMGDFYDVTTVKHPFPCLEEDLSSNSLTLYSNMVLTSGKHSVYFSDTSLGGTFGMTTGLSFFTAGEHSDGSIQAICGATKFLLASCQKRNYYVAGNLPTGNFQQTPLGQTSLGAYSNQAVIPVNDYILFLNKTGLWAVYNGGKCESASDQIKGLFDTFSNTTAYTEEDRFDLSDFPTHLDPYTLYTESSDHRFDKWVKIRHDQNRNLILILTRGADDRGNALVLNTTNGEFYTWDLLALGVFNDLDFYDGEYYLLDGDDVMKEEKEVEADKYVYAADSEPELITTWLTAGEPSLEKKLLQLKAFGFIEGNLEVTTYKDWIDTAVASADYANADAELFSHKLRVESANALAVSVGMKFIGTKFEIEGFELEFSPIQQGMKR